MAEDMIWQRAALVAEVRQSEDRVALLQLDADQPVVLENTAAAIWVLIDGTRTQSGVVAELESNFDDDDGRMPAQVETFMARLAALKLIEPAGSNQLEIDTLLGGDSDVE